jgi:leucine-rich PPR motif-containing protein, mitochondrial
MRVFIRQLPTQYDPGPIGFGSNKKTVASGRMLSPVQSRTNKPATGNPSIHFPSFLPSLSEISLSRLLSQSLPPPSILPTMIRTRTLPLLRCASLRASLPIRAPFSTSPDSVPAADDLAHQISSILSHSSDWRHAIANSDFPGKLTPSLVSSVIRTSRDLNPIILFDFFHYSNAKFPGDTHQLDAYCALAVKLCNANLRLQTRSLFEKLVRTRPPPESVLRCIKEYFSLEGEKSTLVVFDEIILAYRKLGLVDGTNVLLLMKNLNLAPTERCCNGLLNDLFKANLMDLFWKVHEFMINSQVVFDLYTYCIIIKGHFKSGDPVAAKKLFYEMEAKGYKPNLMIYNTMIFSLCITGFLDEALELKNQMVQIGLSLDSHTYGGLIIGTCMKKGAREAKGLLEEMCSHGLHLDNMVYKPLMEGFMREGNYNEVFILKREMDANGIKADKIIYETLISAFGHLGNMEGARAVCDEMGKAGFKPDTRTYNLVLEGCFWKGDKEIILLVLDEMRRHGIRFNSYTFGFAIKGLCRCGNTTTADRLMDEMIQSGISPHVSLCSVLISGYLRETNFSMAIDMLCGMHKRGVSPDIQCYNMLVDGLSKLGQIELATTYFNKIQESGFVPNQFSYAALLRGYSELGEMAKAEFYLEQMVKSGKRPNLVIWTMFISGYLKLNDESKAMSVLSYMAELGVNPDLDTYSVLIDHLSKNGHMKLAFEFFYRLESTSGLIPDAYIYNSLILGLCKVDEIDRAFELAEEMGTKGVSPNIITYNTLLHGLCKSGNLKRATETLGVILEKGLVPNCVTYTTLIDGNCKVGSPDEAIALYEEMLSREIKPDDVVYNSLVHGFAKVGKLDEAEKFLITMVSNKLIPSDNILANLISAFVQAGKAEHAQTVLMGLKEKYGLTINQPVYTALADGLRLSGQDGDAPRLSNEEMAVSGQGMSTS